MKILQLTFTYGNNMGAMLQAYALNRVLTKMGNDSYFLPFYKKPFELPRDKSIRGKIDKLLKKYKGRYYSNEWFYNFNHFLYDHCKFAEYVELKDLKRIENDYDLFLVGSDQVWNIQNYNSEYCLLKWVSDRTKCASYACSLGSYSIRLQNDPVSEAISRFPISSFRELIDYNDAKRNGIQCRIDIDPTFLLEKSEWEDLCDSRYSIFENTVVMFGYDEISFVFAKKYSKCTGKKLIIANYFGNRVFPGIRIVNSMTPIELLSIIRYASCVVTHSYHVFILALNLNKRVFLSRLQNSNSKLLNRFDSVITQYNLSAMEAKVENFDKEIDWNAFNGKLAVARDESMRYLKRLTKND